MDSVDPEERIAELERQLAEAKAAAHEEEVRAQSAAPNPADRTEVTEQQRQAMIRSAIESGWSPAQFKEALQRGPAARTDTRLAPAPRSIPAAFFLPELLPFRWWYVWTLFMVAVTPIAIWIYIPKAFTVAAVLTLVAIYGFQLRGVRKRLALLKWGEVATVSGTQTLSRGTYYSGTTWYNAPLPVANGWNVARPLYSGPSTKTRIRYTLEGIQGELVVSGREYTDGVVLADRRNPARALCVTSFAYDLDRDDAGNWIGKIRPRLAVGMAVWFILVVVWLAVAAVVGTNFAANQFKTTVPRGGNLSVGGNTRTQTIACNDGNLKLSGNDNTFTVTGHCASLKVSGNDNHVTVDSADTITATGNGNTVTYHSGSPKITKGGISVTVQQG
jgi:hypothetical protein